MHPALEPVELAPDAVEVGKITAAWGVKGWFKVQAYSASPEALFSSKRWFVQAPAATSKTARKSTAAAKPLSTPAASVFTGTALLRIKQAKEHGDAIVAQADGVDERDAAEALTGARIFIARASFPSTDEQDEFYWVDLLGLAVYNRAGLALGTVSDLLSTGPQTVLVITYIQEDGKTATRMIPFVKQYVDEVRLADKRMTVDWLPEYD